MLRHTQHTEGRYLRKSRGNMMVFLAQSYPSHTILVLSYKNKNSSEGERRVARYVCAPLAFVIVDWSVGVARGRGWWNAKG
jgi:hypothetical protein